MPLPFALPFGFYQRLTARERVLVLLVGGAVFIVANLVAVSTLTRSFRTLRRDYAEKSDLWNFSRHFIEDKAVWDSRTEWLNKTQPKLTNRNVSGYEMLNQVTSLGQRFQVIVTNAHVRPAGAGLEKVSPDYQALTVEFDTRGDWGAMVPFLEAIQAKPENFLAFDEARLRTEQSDPNTIIGNFRLSRWYAPDGH